MSLFTFRIPASRIWRAFPELDPFTDEEGRAYVREARRQRRLIGVLMHVVGFFLGLAVGCVLGAAAAWMLSRYGPQNTARNELLWTVCAVGGLGLFALSPGVGAMLMRDLWLRIAVRSRLRSASCGGCGYSLLGLAVMDDADMGAHVVCPECGTRTSLQRAGLTPEDLIAETSGPAEGSRQVASQDTDAAGNDLGQHAQRVYGALVRSGVPRVQARSSAQSFADYQAANARTRELVALAPAVLVLTLISLAAFTDLVPGVAWVREWVRPVQYAGAMGYISLLASYVSFLLAHAFATAFARTRYVAGVIRREKRTTRVAATPG